ncbi:MAG TPA: phosphoglycerate dehydrogenase [Chthonomonadales bacterium]|nr:phosphoglycerate dehydrogenase [Chthonomonadales bacterium]
MSDPIAEAGIERLRAVPDVQVDVRTGLKPEELKAVIGEYSALAVRSETKVTAEILAAADKLQIIGRAGVGVDNIDVAAATQRGVVVVNSPDGNTLAAGELTVALILSLARKIPQAAASLREGKWERKRFVGSELYGKTAGIIGLGKIGRVVAQRLAAFEVTLISYSPYVTADSARQVNVELVSLEELCERSDFITIHTPLTEETRGMIGAAQFDMMKPGIRIVNVARGGIVDEAALAEAVKSGRVAGAAFDVYSTEPPKPDNPLFQSPENVLTPHLGASTAEALINVGIDVADQIADVLQGLPPRSAVNMPALSAEELNRLGPYLTLGIKLGSLQTQLAGDAARRGKSIDRVEITFSGDYAGLSTETITRSVLQGLLTPMQPEPVNLVNALVRAQARGIEVTETHAHRSHGFERLLTVRAYAPDGGHTISGAISARDCRIVRIDDYLVDIPPHGHMLVTQHIDQPGIIGRVGTLLGENSINIAGMHVGREKIGGRAIMVLLIDSPLSGQLLQRIREICGIESAQLVSL